MSTHRQGDTVFIPDLEQAYIPVLVLGTDGGLSVRLPDGSTRQLEVATAAQVVASDPLALKGDDDMVRFNLLTEASVVHNLRVRYEREVIYTSVGPILISVNPLRRLEWLLENRFEAHGYGLGEKVRVLLSACARESEQLVASQSTGGPNTPSRIRKATHACGS